MTCETILYAEGGPSGRNTLDRPDDGNIFAPCVCRMMGDGIVVARRANETAMPLTSPEGELTVRGHAAGDGTLTRAGSRRRRCHAAGGGRVVASSLPVVPVFRVAHPRPGHAQRERQP